MECCVYEVCVKLIVKYFFLADFYFGGGGRVNTFSLGRHVLFGVILD